MIKYIYSYRDDKLEYFNNPVFTTEDHEHVAYASIRGLARVNVQEHPELIDASLYYLGTFDDEKCEFKLLAEPQFLFAAKDYLSLDYQGQAKKIDEKQEVEHAKASC